MKAAVYRRYGSPDVVSVDEVPTPVPRDDELLVRVQAVGSQAGTASGLQRCWPRRRLSASNLRGKPAREAYVRAACSGARPVERSVQEI